MTTTKTLMLGAPIELDCHREYPPCLNEVVVDGIYLARTPTSSEHYRLGDYLRLGEDSLAKRWQLTSFDTEQQTATIAFRSARFRAAEETAAFLEEQCDAHGTPGIIELFQNLGGIAIRPGGLVRDDRSPQPVLAGKVHSLKDMIWFQRAEDNEYRDVALNTTGPPEHTRLTKPTFLPCRLGRFWKHRPR